MWPITAATPYGRIKNSQGITAFNLCYRRKNSVLSAQILLNLSSSWWFIVEFSSVPANRNGLILIGHFSISPFTNWRFQENRFERYRVSRIYGVCSKNSRPAVVRQNVFYSEVTCLGSFSPSERTTKKKKTRRGTYSSPP